MCNQNAQYAQMAMYQDMQNSRPQVFGAEFIINATRKRLTDLRAMLAHVDAWKAEEAQLVKILEASGRGEDDGPA